VSNTVLSLLDVRYQWPGTTGFSLSVPEFSIERGETVLLLGESGSGKSTLLSLICGTVSPDSGQVIVAGTDVAKLSGGARDRFRANQIGVIFQQFNLLPFGSIFDNIALPLRFSPERRKRVGDTLQEAVKLCAALGLPFDIRRTKTHALSVGQQQRVAVARALIGHPPLIVADEPTSALDANTQSAFLDLLFAQTEAHQISLLMVSHDPRLGERFDRVIRMDDIAQVKRPQL
jgi:putative ABC transport system ATP-binding protein